MSKVVVVGTEEFIIPEQGNNPEDTGIFYGEELTDYFVAVADALQTVQGPGDITISTANIANNVLVLTSIPGFNFDSNSVISFNSEATVKRTTDVPAVSLVETFNITGNYNGTTWTMSYDSSDADDCGVELDITSAGQVQYTSSNLVGTNVAGSIAFKAKSIIQA